MAAGMKPYLLAIAVQMIYTGMFVISKAAFDEGMSTYVFMFYRQAAGFVLLLPFGLLQRKAARSISSWALLLLFFSSLIGISFCLNLYYICLKFTSATVASVVENSLPVLTFFMALLLRLEHVKLMSPSGAVKMIGVVLCLAGVSVIAFYTGPALSPVNHHHAFSSYAPSGSNANVARGVWIKWTLLMLLANIAWALWIILQGVVLKELPNKMLVTVMQCAFGTVQTFIVALVAERDFAKWKPQSNISLIAVFYAGFVVTGVCNYLQTWCVEMKGPVFLSLWSPLCFLLTMFCSSFFLGEIVHLGSIIGGILLVGALYCVLWGKIKESMTDDGAASGELKNCATNSSDKQEPRIEAKASVDQI